MPMLLSELEWKLVVGTTLVRATLHTTSPEYWNIYRAADHGEYHFYHHGGPGVLNYSLNLDPLDAQCVLFKLTMENE